MHILSYLTSRKIIISYSRLQYPNGYNSYQNNDCKVTYGSLHSKIFVVSLCFSRTFDEIYHRSDWVKRQIINHL